MNTVLNVIVTVIAGADAASIQYDTALKSIPGWDSMTAVTFLITLEDDFAVDLSDLDLSHVATFSQLCEVLRNRGVPEGALSSRNGS
jgi:acyl carrier protein